MRFVSIYDKPNNNYRVLLLVGVCVWSVMMLVNDGGDDDY